MRDGALAELVRLKDELWSYRRSTRDGLWEEILKYTEPSFQNFEDRDGLGSSVNPSIYNSTPALSARMAAMGTAGYACSPSIDWFSYAPEVGEQRGMSGSYARQVRSRLQSFAKTDRQGFATSNWYDSFETAMSLLYEIGTCCVMQEWDDNAGNVVYTVLHPSDFVMMQDRHHVIDTVIWRERLTADEIERAYPGLGKELRDTAKRQRYWWVYHYVGDQRRLRLGCAGERQRYETAAWFGGEGGSGTYTGRSGLLQSGGLDRFPFAIARYQLDPAGNPYGVGSPGMVSLVDNKTLQTLTKDELDCATLQSHPPIKATEGLPLNIGPFAVTRVTQGADFAFVPSGADMSVMAAERKLYEQKIQEAYHVNFFLALMSSVEHTKTATEAEGLKNEQSAMLSSLFDKINRFLESVIEFRYENMVANAMYSEAPREGERMRIDFTSPMRQVQEKAHKWVPLTSKVQFFAQLAQMTGDATILTDNIRLDRVGPLFDEVFDTPSEVGYTEEESQRMKQQRALLQQQQAMAEMQAQRQEADAKMMAARNKAPEAGSPNALGR